MTDLIMLFIIYGFCGWIVEVLYVKHQSGNWYNRGFLTMPFLPIYAVGAIVITVTLRDLPNSFLVYSLGVIVTSALEYITSLIMEKLFHTRWWDYSKKRFNLNGRICLKNSLLFGILCLIVIYGINPLIIERISLIDETLKNLIIDIFAAIFLVDLTYTLRNVSSLPVRDIRVISGKVKAYRDGKLRDLEELLDELEEFKFDGHIRNELKTYTHRIADRFSVHNPLIIGFVVIIILGILIGNVFALEFIAMFIIIGTFIVFYNKRHNHKS